MVLKDEHLIINIILNFMNMKLKTKGKEIHIIIEQIIFIIGETINIIKLDFKFIFSSLPISLIASDIGCRIPIIVALFGPLRFCVYLINLRSNRVKNAILNITDTIKIVVFNSSIILLNAIIIFALLNSKFNTLIMLI